MSAGTSGNGVERFAIYIPFELPTGREIKVESGGSEAMIGGKQFVVERLHHRYALHGGDFRSRNDAESFLSSMRSCLLWFSLLHRIGLRYPETNSECRLYDEPNKIALDNKFTSLLSKRGWTETHGDFDADKAVVKPEHLCLTRWEAGRVSVRTDLSLDRFISAIDQAHQMPTLPQLVANPKTRLAIEVYASAPFESSAQAQFLILVATLEATLVPQEVEAPLAKAIEAAARTAATHLASANSDGLSNDLPGQLANRILGLKQVSITQQFRDQILTNAVDLEPWKTSGTLEKDLKSVYSTRSRLLHDGTTDQERIKSGLAFLRDFVPAYLSEEFRRAASAL